MVVDPRTLTNTQVGTKTRDGAVDPRPKDFLGPINAGEAGEAGNPHGPNVVSPGIHAAGDKVVTPGNMLPLELQEAKEIELAERTRIGNEEVPAVTADLAEGE
jgi:hypothetical protein